MLQVFSNFRFFPNQSPRTFPPVTRNQLPHHAEPVPQSIYVKKGMYRPYDPDVIEAIRLRKILEQKRWIPVKVKSPSESLPFPVGPSPIQKPEEVFPEDCFVNLEPTRQAALLEGLSRCISRANCQDRPPNEGRVPELRPQGDA